MNKTEYQISMGSKLKIFLESQEGKFMLLVLGEMRPAYDYPAQDHLLIENRGAMRGYEQCIRNLILLSSVPNIKKEPEANYGVAEVKSK